MNSKVKEFLDAAKAQEAKIEAEEAAVKAKERDQILISLGLVDEERSIKVYSDFYRDGYSWDKEEEKYYHISPAPIEVTDEEYAEILKYVKTDDKNKKTVNTKNNDVEVFLMNTNAEGLLLIVSVIILLVSTILLFANFHDILDNVIWLAMFIFSIFSFALILVFIKMSKNLQEIKNKIKNIEKTKE